MGIRKLYKLLLFTGTGVTIGFWVIYSINQNLILTKKS